MGISRFYRWISERYPQINEEISDGITPPFDNLYLDVNGIAHNSVNSSEMCTPTNGINLSEKGSPEIWAAIFRYINKLVYIAKPRKLLYIAVDGVAPRAKMNQQRSRRFRSARDSELLKTMEKNNSIDTTKSNVFDSNCITPGTTFMHELRRQLEFFINYQIHTDSLWTNLEVILSGADVPGEGEHKIMDFIRCIKSQKDYNNNTTHCLYGLDADLIMLSLASHEPHFSLLREEIKFSSSRNCESRTVCTKEKFQFLHISILRDYIINDLNPRNLSIEELNLCSGFKTGLNNDLQDRSCIWDDVLIDSERLIDDFIILGFIVGNDFLPHIPFHTVDQGLARIISSYKKYLAHFFLLKLSSSPWILEDCGRINYINLLRFLIWHIISEKEEAEKRISNPDYWKKVIPDRDKINSDLIGVPRFMRSDSIEQDSCRAKWQETRPENFNVMRWRYYFVKMAINIDKFFPVNSDFLNLGNVKSKIDSNRITTNSIEDIVFCYLEGLQWVSYYYFRGVPSWRWYYPYRYAPFACDIAIVLSFWLQNKNISPLSRDDIVNYGSSKLMFIHTMYSEEIKLNGLAFRFIKGNPLQPFEQLMGVLPSSSKDLLPKPFRKLFTNPSSPLLSFYPVNFEVDMEGVKVPWGGVTLIPFIDEFLLLDSITYVLSNYGFYDSDFRNFKVKQKTNSEYELKDRYKFYLKKNELDNLIDISTNTHSSIINGSQFLDIEDVTRNQEGIPSIFYLDNYALPTSKIESTVSSYLPSITNSKVVSKPFYHPVFPDGVSNFPNYLLDNTILPFGRFPNFCRIPYKTYYNSGINIFGAESSNESIFSLISSSHISKDFLNKLFLPSINTKNPGIRILVDYPRVKVAELVSLKTFRHIVRPKLLTKPVIEPNYNPKEFIRLLSNENLFLRKRGIVLAPSNLINVDEELLSISKLVNGKEIIDSKDLDAGFNNLSDPINCLVEARVAESSYTSESGKVEFNYSKISKHYLLPLIILYSDIKEGNTECFKQINEINLGDKFLCINKENPNYGCVGTIIDEVQRLVVFKIPKDKIKVEQLQNRIFEYALEDLSSIQWFSIEDVAKIIYKPLLNCLMLKCGLDATTSLKYMSYSILFIKKLIIGPIQVKCNDNTLQEISMNLFKFENKLKNKFYLPLYSKFVDQNSFITSSNTVVGFGTPIVSNETIKSIIEYLELFPCFVLVIFKSLLSLDQGQLIETGINTEGKGDAYSKETLSVDSSNEKTENIFVNIKKIHVKDIYTDLNDSKDQDFKFNVMIKVIKSKLYRNVPFLSSQTNSATMLPSTISRLERLILNSKIETKDSYMDSSKLFRNEYFNQSGNQFNSGMNKIISRFGYPLGTRVVYTKTNNGLLPFGTVGTVVSVYCGVKVNKEHYPSTILDILLDETQINANNLNGMCSKLRGISVKSSECIPLLPYIQNLKDENQLEIINKQISYFDSQFNHKTEKNRKKNDFSDYWLKNQNIGLKQVGRKELSIKDKKYNSKVKNKNNDHSDPRFQKVKNKAEIRHEMNLNDHPIAAELKSFLSINNSKRKYGFDHKNFKKLENKKNKNDGSPNGLEAEKKAANSLEFKLKQILKIT
ncbi:Kem1p-like exonuclease [Cryptosporidium sp. chipmunk genotype I]|uniref:Kem1p-like exonuclease n=1 Tax=Cryptosporidium sp. chipmunk genotype I TaxID=1280935 RepID=UPI00351A3C5E|nr:Kem1p-like exonuclease [Cryptosporidium sp. chipmunk genotype I]